VLTRPALERLRDLAAEGQIETVLIYAPDRLSRKYAYQVLLIEEFARHGVQTLFVKSPTAQTPEEHLLLQFQGMIAEYERAQIAERTRRGRRHRAKEGLVNVLSAAPYGYRYVKKTEHSQAYFAVEETQAEVVRKIFELYTRDCWSIAAIVRHLDEQKVPTRMGKGLWQTATLWGMLRNPAYQGRAAYGKTQNCPSQKITRPTRQQGGYSRHSSSKAVDRSQWIEIAVPALVSSEVFALAQERLAQNQQLSLRNTKEPSLLQGLLVCEQCGYGLYRSSSRKGPQRRHYYRCGGADHRERLRGPACSCRMIRLDYLDDLVWRQILELLRSPELIRAEMERRRIESLSRNPVEQRQEQLERELSRAQQQMEKLGFMQLTKLRGGYIAGSRRKAMELPHAPPVLPLICYEAIFPGAIVSQNDRPGWIVNVTNDGWFGISTGPYQHLQQTRVRAIEEGLPIVRAANTGISAVIDPFGQIVAKLGLGVEGVLDSGLPSSIAPPLYAQTGDWPVAAGVALAVIFVGWRRKQKPTLM